MKFQKNVSNLHKTVAEMISTCPVFTGQAMRQEVPVSELFPDYNNNRDKYDIVLPNLQVVIEVHGQQHEKPVAFGGDQVAAIFRFQEGKKKDSDKEEIAILSGWTYMCFWYHEIKDLTSEKIVDLYKKNLNPNPVKAKPVKQSSFQKPTEDQKQQIRDRRKELYRKLKEKKK